MELPTQEMLLIPGLVYVVPSSDSSPSSGITATLVEKAGISPIVCIGDGSWQYFIIVRLLPNHTVHRFVCTCIWPAYGGVVWPQSKIKTYSYISSIWNGQRIFML